MRLYPNCIPVTGFKNIVFYDIDRQSYVRFLNSEFFNAGMEISKCFDLHTVSRKGIKLLEENKLLMSIKEDIRDKSMKQPAFYKWKHPSPITNAIIELSKNNELICVFAFNKLIKYLDELLCKHIVLQLKSFVCCNQLKMLIELIHQSEIHSFQLIVPYELEYDTDDFGLFLMQQPKLKYIIFETAPKERNLENRIFFKKGKLKSSDRKHPDQFNTNVSLFSEAQYHHTYFNRKLFVGEMGEIKNAPECEEIHGYIQSINEIQQLHRIIQTPAFQRFWYANKDRCDVCKDCEYRYMCIDNRGFSEKKNGYWYHKQACNYNPYTGEWNS